MTERHLRWFDLHRTEAGMYVPSCIPKRHVSLKKWAIRRSSHTSLIPNVEQASRPQGGIRKPTQVEAHGQDRRALVTQAHQLAESNGGRGIYYDAVDPQDSSRCLLSLQATDGDGIASYLRGPLPLGVRRAGLHRLPLSRLPSVWPQGRPQMPRDGVVAQGKVSAGLRKKPQQGRVYAACGPKLLRLRRLRPPIRGRFVGRHPVRCRGFKSRTPLHFLFLLSKIWQSGKTLGSSDRRVARQSASAPAERRIKLL